MNNIIKIYSISAFILLISFAFAGCKEGNGDRQSAVKTSDSQSLTLNLQSQKKTQPGNNVWEVVTREEIWHPEQTVIIVTDMWDRHWCKSATERVAELAPVMNEVITEARRRGILIIHAPKWYHG